MKSLLRSFVINIVSLWITAVIANGFLFAKGYETIIIAGLVLGLVNLFVRPIINILLLPINLITLGAFRWIVNVVALFAVTLIVQDFKILGFAFPGFSYGTISLPAFSADGIMGLVLNSFLLSIISGFLSWICK